MTAPVRRRSVQGYMNSKQYTSYESRTKGIWRRAGTKDNKRTESDKRVLPYLPKVSGSEHLTGSSKVAASAAKARAYFASTSVSGSGRARRLVWAATRAVADLSRASLLPNLCGTPCKKAPYVRARLYLMSVVGLMVSTSSFANNVTGAFGILKSCTAS